MDFNSQYLYVIILIVGAIAKWMKSRSEAAENKKQAEEIRARQAGRVTESPIPEPKASRPAVPPPFPRVERSPVPQFKQNEKAPPQVPKGAIDSHQAELERQHSIAQRVKEFKLAEKIRTTGVDAMQRRAATRNVVGGIASRLGNRRELRQAFVLKEILEKPVGLR